MCGICGTFMYADVRLPNQDIVRAMTGRMTHRGPDDEGFHFSNTVGLGFRRLSIIDIQGGHQPISNEDGSIWVTLNGEIYNYRELRVDLEACGHVFRTRTDTEVIVHGYEEWGDDCVSHFNGMFGLAVWDSRLERVLLARDHFGVKPLYYCSNAERLSWASEIRALLADPSIPSVVERESIDQFLRFRFVPSPATMLRGVFKLPPGHRLLADRKGSRVERYSCPRRGATEVLSERDYVVLLQDRLETAVRRQMMSDVPVGALLSGGLDSAVVVAIMKQCAKNPVHTFSVGFEDGGVLNELEDARRTAALFGTEHHMLTLTSGDFVEGLEETIWKLEEPIGSISALSMYRVCALAHQHVKVVLTGQGADEPFCGYQRYLGERYGGAYRRVPRIVRRWLVEPLVQSLPGTERLKRAVMCLGEQDVVPRFASVYSMFGEALLASLWRPSECPEGTEEAARRVVRYWQDGIEDRDPLVQMSFIDSRLSLSDDFLTYGDKMAMAASVEARVPFLDLDMMAATEGLPASLRVRRWQRKYIYRKVVAKWLPKEIMMRPKRGFDAPTGLWFRETLSGFLRQTLLSTSSVCPAYFNPDVIQRLLGDHMSGQRDHRQQIYSLLVFELWHRQFSNTPTAAAYGGLEGV